MKMLVIGGSGLVGGALLRTAPSDAAVSGTAFTQTAPKLTRLDARDKTQVRALLSQGFDWVMLPAANPNVDACECDPTHTRAINVDAVSNVAEACAQHKTGLVYFSSDYVFDGLDGPYDEHATPNPICEYGRQKLEAERIVSKLDKHIVVRTTGVFGLEHLRKNFLYRAVQTLRRKDALIVPADQSGNPTLADDLARMTWKLLPIALSGVFHVAGRNHLSRLEFARLIAEVFGLDANLIQGLSTATLGQVAPRPLRAGLVSERAERLTRHAMLETRTALESICDEVSRDLKD